MLGCDVIMHEVKKSVWPILTPHHGPLAGIIISRRTK